MYYKNVFHLHRYFILYSYITIVSCPGFGQDRVNFHQKPRGDTAGQADTDWPNRIGYSIPCAAMLGSSWGKLGRGK